MNMRAVIGIVLTVALVACNNKSVTTSKMDSTTAPFEVVADENQITCWGIGEIELEDNFSSIEKKVGTGAITIDSIFLEGTFERLVTTLWKGTGKELIIHWEETKPPFNSIRFLEISNPKSIYSFVNGIKIGTTLNELATINNKPIALYGFGWDYGGTFIDFGKGKLASDIPCFGGVFQLQPLNKTDTSLIGDKKISSSDPAFKTQKAILKVLRISKNSN